MSQSMPNMNIDTPEGMRNAVAWQKQHLSLIKSGGAWIVPRSMSVIRINHETKTATHEVGFLPEPVIARVFKEMGWTWRDQTND